MSGKVIILNGVGSAGKTSTAAAMQSMLREPHLHVQGDSFLEMMDPRLWNTSEGISVTNVGDDSAPSLAIEMGPAFQRIMAGMRSSVAALAGSGNHCIVDDVMLSASDQQVYRELLPPGKIRFVGLHAPLDVLEQRKRARGDRMIGLARWQIDRVHAGMDYDYECNTSSLSPERCAALIIDALGLKAR